MPGGDEKAFFSLIRAAFSQRRKTAANAISNGLQLPKATVLSALEAAHLDPRSRPEQLTLQDYCALQAAFQAVEEICFFQKITIKTPLNTNRVPGRFLLELVTGIEPATC